MKLGTYRSERRLTASFTAMGDDKQKYSVQIYTWFAKCRSADGSIVEVQGQRELVTMGGLGVTRLGPGRFLIDETGVSLWSHDPAAQ